MVDHCGQGLFHRIAWQNCPIQIVTIRVPRYLGIWEYSLNIPGTPGSDQQFSRATILAYDRQGQAAQVVTIESHDVEGVELDLLVVLAGVQRVEVGDAVGLSA